MGGLDKAVSSNLGLVVLLLGILLVITTAVAVTAFLHASATRKKFRSLLSGVRGETLEQLLSDHMKERAEHCEQLNAIADRVRVLESKMETSKRYLGVVRYNAFEDVGGDQSFSLAFYDERGHGAIITSVVGRTNARVYCKEIEAGQAKKDLSAEEQAALEAAARQRAETKKAGIK